MEWLLYSIEIRVAIIALYFENSKSPKQVLRKLKILYGKEETLFEKLIRNFINEFLCIANDIPMEIKGNQAIEHFFYSFYGVVLKLMCTWRNSNKSFRILFKNIINLKYLQHKLQWFVFVIKTKVCNFENVFLVIKISSLGPTSL